MGLSAEGFFLPKEARQALLGENPPFQSWTLRYGQPCAAEDPQAVTARWPLLQPPQWEGLLDILGRNRARVPQGEAYWERFRQALARAGRCLADPADPRHQKALQTLPLYTGYSSSMVQLALRALDWFSLDDYAALFSFTPTWRSAVRFQRMGELPGWLRFYPRSRWHAWLGALPLVKDLPLLHRLPPPGLILGYGAGNVPGTALLIALLAQTLALVTAIPSIVIRNSRHEPIFGPLVLQALEEADPELVSTTALLVWDYEDETLQRFLLRRADLMIAAASDTTIAALEKQCQTVRRAHPQRRAPRLHPHGHKVSFAAIGGEFLGEQGGDPLSGALGRPLSLAWRRSIPSPGIKTAAFPRGCTSWLTTLREEIGARSTPRHCCTSCAASAVGCPWGLGRAAPSTSASTATKPWSGVGRCAFSLRTTKTSCY